MTDQEMVAINAALAYLEHSLDATIRLSHGMRGNKYRVDYFRDCHCDEGPDSHWCSGYFLAKDEARLDEYLADRLNGGFMPDGLFPCIEHLAAWGMLLLLENPSLRGEI